MLSAIPGSGPLDWALAIFDPNRRQTPRLEAQGFVTHNQLICHCPMRDAETGSNKDLSEW